MPEYVIQRGDDFYRLAQRFGGNCEDWQLANPGINPVTLQIGQKVVLPPILNSKAREQYAELTTEEGKEFAGDHMDDVEMEIEGVRFRIKRIGESKIPHEIHLIVPRTEIRKIQPQGEQGPCEVQIMLSNVDIVHSPRLMSEGEEQKRQVRRRLQRQLPAELRQCPSLLSQGQAKYPERRPKAGSMERKVNKVRWQELRN